MMSVTAILIAGCGINRVGGNAQCDWVQPIRPSRGDQLTDGTARQILAHNKTGVVLCEWQP
jgi:hypothetical protein